MKRKGRKLGKYILILSSIAALNCAGLSYAYWDQDTDILVNTSTGCIKPTFNNSYNIDDKGEGKLEVRFNDDHTMMLITGEVSPGYTGDIDFDIANKGTLPVILRTNNTEDKFKSDDIQVKVNIYGQGGGHNGILQLDQKMSSKSPNKNPYLHIEVSDKQKSGEDAKDINTTFKLFLPFDQYTK